MALLEELEAWGVKVVGVARVEAMVRKAVAAMAMVAVAARAVADRVAEARAEAKVATAARVMAARAVTMVVALAVASSAATATVETKVAVWVAAVRPAVEAEETARPSNARGLAGSHAHYLCTTSSRLKSLHMRPMAAQLRCRQGDTCPRRRELADRD